MPYTEAPVFMAEMALAYVIENRVEAAYRRGDLFTKRLRMMQEWADFVDKPERRQLLSTVPRLPLRPRCPYNLGV